MRPENKTIEIKFNTSDLFSPSSRVVLLQYGPVFSFTMVGKTFTYLVGSEAASLMFNSKNEDLNAEDVYSKLTTPVFGKGVAYDVPNPVSLYLIIFINTEKKSLK